MIAKSFKYTITHIYLRMRQQIKTKIVCTIGPRTESYAMLERLARAGMNVARLNFTHGTHRSHGKVIDRIKRLNRKLKHPIAVMLDTQGPEIRTQILSDDITLDEGETLTLLAREGLQAPGKYVAVDYPNIVKHVKKGGRILLSDGLIELEVLSYTKNKIECVALNSGVITSRRSVLIPNTKIGLPAITKKDIKDIEFGLKKGVDFISQSFVKSADDVASLKKILEKKKSSAKIVSKIEEYDAVNNFDGILEVSDAIMVARGDLGVEMPLEEVPLVQKKLVEKSIKAGKPVIIATHLLESMTWNPRPTRAEVTDVASAVLDKVDALMLSGETTRGRYPLKSVKTLVKISKRIEEETEPRFVEIEETADIKDVITRIAYISSESLKAKALLVFTKTGRMAHLLSKYRPTTTLYAFTENPNVVSDLSLAWGVIPFKIRYGKTRHVSIDRAVAILVAENLIVRGDIVVSISDIASGRLEPDVLEIRTIK